MSKQREERRKKREKEKEEEKDEGKKKTSAIEAGKKLGRLVAVICPGEGMNAELNHEL